MRLKQTSLTLAALITTFPVAVSSAVRLGPPPPGEPNTFTTWTAFTCPEKDECPVDINVTDVSGDCKIDVVHFIDRSEKKPNQTIVWKINKVPAGYTVTFRDGGIVMTEGENDMQDVPVAANEKDKTHKKKVKHKDPKRSFLTYDILLKFTGPKSGSCKNWGPAIVNRG